MGIKKGKGNWHFLSTYCMPGIRHIIMQTYLCSPISTFNRVTPIWEIGKRAQKDETTYLKLQSGSLKVTPGFVPQHVLLCSLPSGSKGKELRTHSVSGVIGFQNSQNKLPKQLHLPKAPGMPSSTTLSCPVFSQHHGSYLNHGHLVKG